MAPDARPDEFRRGWPVVAVCFGVAVMAWGFSIYGQSVFLAELRRIHGWSASMIGGFATTAFLLSAVLLGWIGTAIDRFGARAVLTTGIACLTFGTIGLGWVAAPWQLLPCQLAIGVGWVACSSAAIATTLARWFDVRRGYALGLALAGASTSGFVVAPLLIWLSAAAGFRLAVLIVAGGLGAVMAPAVLLVVRNPPLAAPVRRPGAAAGHGPTHVATRAEALRDGHFWSFAGPFAIALCVQVGFIFHQIAFLLPLLGPGRTSLAVGAGSVTALAGRLSLGTRVDRMNQRRASAGVFLLQAAGICTMLVLPRSPPALFLGCMLFGLSVGSLVLFPPMIVQREFSPASFGLVVGLSTGVGQLAYALFPGLLGAVHDLTGGYPAVLTLCVVLGLLAAGLIAIPPRRRHP